MGDISRYYQKCALPVQGKPLIIHWLDAIWWGIPNVYAQACLGHHAEQTEYMIGQWKKLHNVMSWPDTRLVDDLERGIWRDTIQGIPAHRGRNMLLCYADNFSPRLKDIISAMSQLGERMGDKYWAAIGLIPNSRCSKATESAVLGKNFHIQGTAEIIEYRTGLSNPPENAHSWAGIGIFRPETFELSCDTPHEVFKHLAENGKLLGWVIPDECEYRDIQIIYEKMVP